MAKRFHKPLASYILCVIFYFLWCSWNQVFADNRTFIALSLRNIDREISAVGGDAGKLKLEKPSIYFLSGITRPAFVVFDENSGDAILVGEQNKDGVVLTLDDWMTALRTAIVHPEQDPGVSIDPTACDKCKTKGIYGCPHTSTLKVSFFGGLENTRIGEVCFEADWWMKLLSLGEIQSPLKGLRSWRDLVGVDAQKDGMSKSLLTTRFWFYPLINRVNLLDGMVLLQDFKMGVFTQVMYAEENGRPVLDLSRQYHTPSDKFASSLTESYGELAESQKNLASLREFTRLLALAKGCVISSSSFDFRKMMSKYHGIKISIPTEKDVIIQYTFNRRIEISGGVELKALAMRLKDGDASAFRQIVFKARPTAEAVTWKFIVKLENGIPEGVTIPLQTASGSDLSELLCQARFLYISNRFDDAAKFSDSILKDFPNCDDAVCLKAIALREGAIMKDKPSIEGFRNAFSQVQASIEILEQLTKRNPKCVQAFFELGVTHRAFHFQNEAIEDFNNAIKLSPDFVDAHYMLGLTWKEAKNYTNAANSFRTVLSLESNTENAKDAAEQLAILQQSFKVGRRKTLKEYSLQQSELSFRYPEDWIVLTPEEFLKKARGNTVLTPKCVLVVYNPDNYDQNVTVQISEVAGYNSVSPQELILMWGMMVQDAEKKIEGYKELYHSIIKVSEEPALVCDGSGLAWGKRYRQRAVLFVKKQRLFTITCTALESEFVDAEAKSFQFVIDTLKIGSSQP